VPNLLFVTTAVDAFREIQQKFSRNGSTFSVTRGIENIYDEIVGERISLIVLDISSQEELDMESDLWTELREIKKSYKLSIITLIPRELIGRLNSRYEIADFVIKPVSNIELETRIKRALKQLSTNGDADIIKCGELVINQTTCEVSVAGIPAELTFKEYELLKFMASNKGRVYTREALLNEVWGYDYFGGDRTVDVHIRRLRSKIEATGFNFIDTVRNIGYKFHNGS
jgi:two-component system, OmpR family, alkaline phosphatase synthesis response regulator PhoP